MTAQELIADMQRRGILLATDGVRLYSKTKGITPGVAAELAPLEADIIKELTECTTPQTPLKSTSRASANSSAGA